jgi:tetratricopeptide (TPR) repeat protein
MLASLLITATDPAACASAATAGTAEINSASRLLQATSVDRVLRIDLSLISMNLEQLPADMPPQLGLQLRRIVASELDYAPMHAETARLVSSRLSPAAIQQNLQFWESPPGATVTDAEGDAYSRYAGGPVTRWVGVPVNRTPDGSAIRELTAIGGFIRFAHELHDSVQTSHQCLLRTVTLGPDCSTQQPTVNSEPIESSLQSAYARLPAADLKTYLTYLKSGGGAAVVDTLRAAVLEVEKNHASHVLDAVTDATREYLRTRVGDPEQALRTIVAAVDAGQDLEQTRVALQLLRRVDPQNPAVPVELARVALKLAPASREYFPATPPRVDPHGLEEAQHWLDIAHALDPQRADTLVLEGHLAYLQEHYDRSVEILEQARKIGTTNPWLTINLADALWARSARSTDKESLGRAALEFEAAAKYQAGLKVESTPRIRAVIYQQLAGVYTDLGDLRRAERNYRLFVAAEQGADEGFALKAYASFLLWTVGDADRSLAMARAGFELADDPMAESLLATVLLVKSGQLFAAGQRAAALQLVTEARRVEPDLETETWRLASDRVVYPGLRALHDSGVIKDFSVGPAGQALGRVCMWGGATEIDQLMAWGADPNHLDPNYGTALHLAIFRDNMVAVKALLARGADPLTRYTDGRLPSQLTGKPSDAKRAEILALVQKAAQSRKP